MKPEDKQQLEEVKRCFADYYGRKDLGENITMHSSGCLAKLHKLTQYSLLQAQLYMQDMYRIKRENYSAFEDETYERVQRDLIWDL